MRGSEFPDSEADLGLYTFTYAVYPHAGTWQSAQTVRKSYELSHPLQLVHLDDSTQQGHLAPIGSLLDLQSDHLILSTFKQSEDDPETYIIRCYKCHGEATELKLKSDLGLALNQSVDLLERPSQEDDRSPIQPWKIKSFSVLPYSQSKL